MADIVTAAWALVVHDCDVRAGHVIETISSKYSRMPASVPENRSIVMMSNSEMISNYPYEISMATWHNFGFTLRFVSGHSDSKFTHKICPTNWLIKAKPIGAKANPKNFAPFCTRYVFACASHRLQVFPCLATIISYLAFDTNWLRFAALCLVPIARVLSHGTCYTLTRAWF